MSELPMAGLPDESKYDRAVRLTKISNKAQERVREALAAVARMNAEVAVLQTFASEDHREAERAIRAWKESEGKAS